MDSHVAPSPYKFLDHYDYTEKDQSIFFGRERETEILLADVLVQRLVVLFARTGTGKTSLINAGVRPRLHEQEFETFLVRVSKDPTESARTEIVKALQAIAVERKLPAEQLAAQFLEGNSLAEQLIHLTKLVEKPIVLFFDQFEEFFIHVKPASEQGRQFISDIGAIYRNRDSGVHIVFSMREEFFVEMDAFRSEIPSIFHNESNLRLRCFNLKQARDAIVRPAESVNVRVDDKLVEQLLKDLPDPNTNEIEPAQLQIVCDTLWWEKRDPAWITLEDYRALAQEEGGANIALQILNRRLARSLSKLKTREDLDLLENVLPLLRTGENTKYPRYVTELKEKLNTSTESLNGLIKHLEGAQLISKSGRGPLEIIELKHDYLVARLDDITRMVKGIWSRRILERSIPLYEQDSQKLMSPEDLGDVSAGADALRLNHTEAEFLFRSALAYGGSQMRLWFDLAQRNGVDVWQILEEQFSNLDLVLSANVIDLLKDLRTPEVFNFLQRALGQRELTTQAQEVLLQIAKSPTPDVADRAGRMLTSFLADALEQEESAPSAVDLLSRFESSQSVSLLLRALSHDAIASKAQDALERFAKSTRTNIADNARYALLLHLEESLARDDRALSAVETLGRIEAPRAVDLLEPTLKKDSLALAAARSLERLTRSKNIQVSSHAQDALFGFLQSALAVENQAEFAVEVLGHFETNRAVTLLEKALRQPDLIGKAQGVLERYTKSSDPAVAQQAQSVLNNAPTFVVTLGSAAKPAKESLPIRTVPDPLDAHYASVAKAMMDGRVVPFLGPGVNLAGRPSGVPWQRGRYVPSSAELSAYLADVFRYPENDKFDLARVSQYIMVVTGSGPLYEELHRTLDADYPLTPVHQFLATLAAVLSRKSSIRRSLLIVTTNYDDLMERAFQAANEPFDLVTFVAKGEQRGKFLHYPPNGNLILIEKPNEYRGLPLDQRSVILKINGGVDRGNPDGDNYVMTEDDYIDYWTSTAIPNLLPVTLVARMRRSHFLFLGYGLHNWSLRVILHCIWGGQKLTYKSWAIQRNPSPVDQIYWRRRDIEIINTPLEEYIAALYGRIQTTG